MKKIEELGVSPVPWTNKLDCGAELNSVWDARLGQILSGGYIESVADARLIAAAPKMYVKAWELITAFDRREMTPEHIEALRAALAEAAGEEVSDGKAT